MSNRTFYTLFLSFFAGIFVASFATFPRGGAIAATLFSACIALIARVYFKRRGAFGAFAALLFLFSIAAASFALGVVRFQVSQSDTHPLDVSIGKKTSLTGMICAEPNQTATGQRFCFEPYSAKGMDTEKSRDRILVSPVGFSHFRYGDEISVSGTLKLPKNFQAYDGGPTFDYISYLAKDDIRYTMSFATVKKRAGGKGNTVIAGLIWIKSAFMDKVDRLLPGTPAALVGGLILGEQGALPKDVSENFRRSGLTHILVLSGSNVTVVAESLLAVLAFLPRAIGQWLGGLSIVLFALMTGASSTTIRATIMALIHLFAQGMGRRYDVVRALVLSAFFMLVQNPRILAFDISFQLSFLATIAVIFVSPLVKERLTFVTEKFAVREVLSMTLSVQIFTLPFILSQMGEISVIALAPNLLVLPIVPYAMLGGFVTGAVGLASIAFARPFAWVTNLMLAYMLKVVAFFGGLSFATIKAPLGAPFLFGSYAVYALVLIFLWRRRNSPRSSSS